MAKVEKMTKDRREVIIQDTIICNLGSVRYKKELIDDTVHPYLLSKGFKNAMKLPDEFDSRSAEIAYFKFIESWGTVSYSKSR